MPRREFADRSGDWLLRKPIKGFAGCCARAASGHAAAAPPSSVMNSRRGAHSITSSARASSDSGMSMPSALAVFRFITSSCLVGACTGRSLGLVPLRMRST